MQISTLKNCQITFFHLLRTFSSFLLSKQRAKPQNHHIHRRYKHVVTLGYWYSQYLGISLDSRQLAIWGLLQEAVSARCTPMEKIMPTTLEHPETSLESLHYLLEMLIELWAESDMPHCRLLACMVAIASRSKIEEFSMKIQTWRNTPTLKRRSCHRNISPRFSVTLKSLEERNTESLNCQVRDLSKLEDSTSAFSFSSLLSWISRSCGTSVSSQYSRYSNMRSWFVRCATKWRSHEGYMHIIPLADYNLTCSHDCSSGTLPVLKARQCWCIHG